MLLLSRSLQSPIVPRMRGIETETKISLCPSPGRVCYYDVFLSFRGDDTRKTVASHLYRALVARGIPTFKDDPEIELGETITETLQGAIRNSRFAVVVISKNYATSKWCLEELRMIMELELKKEIGVIPVFYEVAPSELRNLLGNFALRGPHRGIKKAKMIPQWKEALRSIADREGTESRKCKDDATMVEQVVRHISRSLSSTYSMELEAIDGMKDHMESLRPLLDMDSKNDEVRMIGIWGMRGIGKTSIAKYIYERHKNQFSTHHCFMEDVSSKQKPLYFQRQLLSNITGEENPWVWNVDDGAKLIELRLRNLKALIVIDNVDDPAQLHFLAREASWFGRGSRIIITTRDRSLLSSDCKVYKVKYLDDDKALQLFQRIAFQGGKPPSSAYKDLSNRVSRLSQGLPLALEAFGFYLRDKSLTQWQHALKSFEEAPYEKIMKVLKISYDNLEALDQSFFLHVACLFNGDPVWRVKTLLHHAEVGIKVLEEKSLIDISKDGHIVMHRLLEQMGRQIVRQESGDTPAQQRILWHHEVIYQVLADNAGTRKIEGLALDASVPYDFPINWNHFKPMHNLSFMKIYNHYGGLDSCKGDLIPSGNLVVPQQLRFLHWDAYPFTTLPSSVRLDCLVELNLCYSKLTVLWSGTPRLLLLRRLNLTGSMHLKELPDLQEAVSLEELILKGCISLRQIPKSICSLSRLEELDVSNCYWLKKLKIKITKSKSTEFQGGSVRVRSVRLSFYGAAPFVEESQGVSVTNLSIKGNLQIELMVLGGFAEHLSFTSEKQISHKLVMSRHNSTLYSFKSLDIMRFNYSEKSGDFKCRNFSEFPWLHELKLINLNIQKIPEDIHHMQVLEKLDLSGNDFKGLPTSMLQLSKLKHLRLCNCRNLEKLPDLYQVERLTLSDCTNLRKLVNLPHAEQNLGRYSLRELCLENCNSVESLSDQLGYFTKLTYLDLSSHGFETVPTSLMNLTSLVTLCFNNCTNLVSLTGLPPSLKRLNAHGCNSLKDSSLPIKHSIDHLDLSPCPLPEQESSLPAWGYSKEVPVCARGCSQILSTVNKVTPSLSQRLKSWLCAFARCILVAGLAILVVSGIDYLTSTNMSIHIYLLVAIFLYKKL